uniref:Uncharacterized protein n=1 Tax=Leersia perrieri TaxID=77586 RepID=A0A0D9XNT8_9ORYZ
MMVEEEEEKQRSSVGRSRWLVDVGRWRPSPAGFRAAAAILPPHDRLAIDRFVREDDRKRALVSRLLQYSLVHHALGIPPQQIHINRTLEGKPYLENKNVAFPSFNFNTSDQGDYVGIASEPLCLVGLDIASISKPQGETMLEFIKNFTSNLTEHEWNCIVSSGCHDEMLTEFYRYWCLKEAFVKAIGAGVGFGLRRLEFHHKNWTNISLCIDGEEARKWRFWLCKIDEMHLASIAKGNPDDAIESFKRTLSDVVVQEEEPHTSLEIPEEAFTLWTVEQLIQIDFLETLKIPTEKTTAHSFPPFPPNPSNSRPISPTQKNSLPGPCLSVAGAGTHTLIAAMGHCCSKGAGKTVTGDDTDPSPSKSKPPSRGASSNNATPSAAAKQPRSPASKKPSTGPIGDVLGRPMEEVRSTYSIGKELGRGQFGITHLCTHKSTGEKLACKTIAKRKLTTKEDVDDVMREVEIMHHLTGHANIVALHGAYEDKHNVHLIIAGCLSEEEIKGLKEMFKNIDKDNSGTITLEELKNGLAKQGPKLSDSEIEQLMEAADADGNGMIDYEEFVTATVHMNKMDREEHLYTAFQYFDKDNSGYITKEELEQALKEQGLYDAKEIKDVITEADSNNDGRIDYSEFVAMMRKGSGCAEASNPKKKRRDLVL